MNPFESPLSQFVVLESMVQFYAPLDVVSEKFHQAWTKWHLNGLGEAFGFCLTFNSSGKPFVVKTLVNTVGLDETTSIEWHIDAGDLATAELVFAHLGLPESSCTWRKS